MTSESSGNKEKTGQMKKADSRRLELSSILAIVFLSLAAIALAYIGGVMSGRHSGGAEPMDKAVVRPSPARDAPASEQKILSADELEFARILRGESPRRPPQPVPEEADKKQKDEDKPAVTAEVPEKAGLPEANIPEQPGSVYDYVLQVAAFRDEAAADRLRQSLEGHGLRTLLERDGKMCVVLVRIRGTEERLAELAQIAAKLKLGVPLLRTRKAVPH